MSLFCNCDFHLFKTSSLISPKFTPLSALSFLNGLQDACTNPKGQAITKKSASGLFLNGVYLSYDPGFIILPPPY